MDSPIINEHDKVVKYLEKSFSNSYTVCSNLGKEEYFISSIFPDLILKNKQTGTIMFIIEVKKNGEVAKCLQQWKTVNNIPAILYLFVPALELSNAKAVAQAIGIQVKFGSYEFVEDEIKIAVF